MYIVTTWKNTLFGDEWNSFTTWNIKTEIKISTTIQFGAEYKKIIRMIQTKPNSNTKKKPQLVLMQSCGMLHRQNRRVLISLEVHVKYFTWNKVSVILSYWSQSVCLTPKIQWLPIEYERVNLIFRLLTTNTKLSRRKLS